MYDDVNAFLLRVEKASEAEMNSRKKFSNQELDALRRKHAGVPKEFLAYLHEVGAGAFRQCQYTVYGFLGTPDSILGVGVLRLKEPQTKLLCFGDNFSGDLGAFLSDEAWAVVDLCHDDGTMDRTGQTFGQYIRKRMRMPTSG